MLKRLASIFEVIYSTPRGFTQKRPEHRFGHSTRGYAAHKDDRGVISANYTWRGLNGVCAER